MQQVDMTKEEFIAEERRRTASAAACAATGHGCEGPRRAVSVEGRELMLPEAMLSSPEWAAALRQGGVAVERLRIVFDFEFWAWRCVCIRHKLTGETVPFELNSAQRKLLAAMETQRRAGQPIRIILLKARQWGGSTLVQLYMAWIQLVHRRNWHSYICGHVKDAARNIRAMYQSALASYPEELFDGDATASKPEFKGFGQSANINVVAGRGARVTVGSSVAQEASRSADLAMAHLSEVAFWGDAVRHDPADLVRAIVSGIALQPLTLVAMESTANGVGDFFHREWLRAQAGESDKLPVFVAWHEIEAYRATLTDTQAWEMFSTLSDPYELELWHTHGAPMAAIAWYRAKRREYASHHKMMAEYPTTPIEAFSNTGAGVFAVEAVERLRGDCREPASAFAGRWEYDQWEAPRPGASYVAGVDVGGRSDKADWSVIVVVKQPRRADDKPAIVAQWRGHDDHDLLGLRAEAIAGAYNGALLVVESNTLESEGRGDSSAVLDRLRRSYSNLYMRHGASGLDRIGFQTNVSTKAAIISMLHALVRDGGYTERCSAALDELCSYEQRPNGSYGARPGCHDDMLMARAIALYVAATTNGATTSSLPLLRRSVPW